MAEYDRLRDDFINLAKVLQDFNTRLERLEQAVAKLSVPPPAKDEPVLPLGSMTVQTFLKATGMSRSSFYAYAQQGRIEVRKFGHRNYILNSELERWLRELERR
jgi:hypothetical protein